MRPDASGPSGSTGRLAQLNAVKLAALARPLLDGADAEPAVFGGGAALVAGSRVVVLLDEVARLGDGRGLGAALIWARRRGADRLDVLTEHAAPVMARRAAEFTLATTVWAIDGTTIAAAEPASFDARHAGGPPAGHLEYFPTITAAGATPRVEGGAAVGEVKGLEVCRIVDGESGEPADVRIEVGVGAHDREAFAMIHGDVPTPDSLRRVVESVEAVRGHDRSHPLSTLAAERLARWDLITDPAPLGLVALEAIEPPVARVNLKDPTPCVALGRDAGGTEALVVVSVGVDLDVIPFAADARLATERDGLRDLDVIVAVPERDLVAATVDLAAALGRPVRLVALPAG